jgi:peptidoglycan hydrolase CwlO-like protein
VSTSARTYDSSEEELQEVTRAADGSTGAVYHNALFETGDWQQQMEQKLQQMQQQVAQLQQRAEQAEHRTQAAQQQAHEAQQQAQEARQETARLRDLLSKAGIDCDDGAVQVKAQRQRLEAVEQQQEEQKAQLTELSEGSRRMQQQLSAQQPAKCVLYAPATHTPELVAQQVSDAAHMSAASIKVKCVYVPAESQAGHAAGNSSSSGNSSGNGGNNGGSRRRLAVWVLTLPDREDARVILSGRTRRALKDAGLPLYVDDHLTPEQRARRKQLQPERQRLRTQQVRTRWVVADLQRYVQDGQGRWGWQQVEAGQRAA